MPAIQLQEKPLDYPEMMPHPCMQILLLAQENEQTWRYKVNDTWLQKLTIMRMVKETTKMIDDVT